MESTIDDCFTISDNAGILEEKRLTGYNRDDIMFFVDGSLAQLVEHLTLNQGVVGSRPTWVTKIWPVGQAVKTPPFHGGIRGSIPPPVTIRALSSAGSASALQAECRRFDPVSAHQKSGISKKLGYAFFI